MQFYSLAFILFTALCMGIYYAGPVRKRGGQWIVLLAASLFYYALMGGGKAFFFILVTAATTYAAGRLFSSFTGAYKEAKKGADRETKKALKKAYLLKKRTALIVVLLINFGTLAALKYVGALKPSLFGAESAAGLVLPIGISFYTFQSVSYVIDTYSGKYPAERNFLCYLLFVSFFPQILQGPINRYDALAPQLSAEHGWKFSSFAEGLLRILYGFLKKYAIANLLAPVIADLLDTGDPSVPGSAVVLGILLYSAQQYADFSGGIDIVIGVADLFDIHMAENFRQPYFAVSLGDFWRRWHITLGTWMRDYVFYPFALTKAMQRFGKWAGKHQGKHAGRTLPACVANILVFFIVGIWHGPEEHYIAWGLYNGLVIAGSDLLAPAFARLAAALHMNTESKGFHVFRIIRTFVIVNIGWYFDRIYDFSHRAHCFKNTFFHFDLRGGIAMLRAITDVQHLGVTLAFSLFACLVVFVISVVKERGTDVGRSLYAKKAVPAAFVLACGALIVLVGFGLESVPGGFLYANF